MDDLTVQLAAALRGMVEHYPEARPTPEAKRVLAEFDAAKAHADRVAARGLTRVGGDAAWIAEAMVREAIKRGHFLSVQDGEEWVLQMSADAEAVLDALASTDFDRLRVHCRDESEKTGSIMLIWENGNDVISDYHCVPAVESLVEWVEQAYQNRSE